MTHTIEIYDATLRDGTQDARVSEVNTHDKLVLAKRLDEYGVDFIELGWPGSNPTDMEAFQAIKDIELKSAKVAAFGSTCKGRDTPSDDKNLQALIETGAPVTTIFGKSHEKHVTHQLKTTLEDNLQGIQNSVLFLKSKGKQVFYDAEHFFDGFKVNSEYALSTVVAALVGGAERIVLCDTNGGTLPHEILDIFLQTKHLLEQNGYGDVKFGMHAHNDGGTAVANNLVIAKYLTQIQATVGGFGERVGNANHTIIIPNLMLKLGIDTNVNLDKTQVLYEQVCEQFNLEPDTNMAFAGKNAFAHKGGIHGDAERKMPGAYCHIDPTLVGNESRLVVSDLSGGANIVDALEKFGIYTQKSDERVRAMLEKIKKLHHDGTPVGLSVAEQYLVAAEYFGLELKCNRRPDLELTYKRVEWEQLGEHEHDTAVLQGVLNGKRVEGFRPAQKGGPIGVAYEALRDIYTSQYPEVGEIKLIDWKDRVIALQGAKSVVRVYIDFVNHEDEWRVYGVSDNILNAGLTAITKGFDYYVMRHKNLKEK